MQDFDAFGTLKALRNMKRDLETKKVPAKNNANIVESLQYMQKRQPITQQDLRTQFQTLLSKLTNLSTKETALKECKKLIGLTVAENSLQTILSCLSVPLIINGNDGLIKVIQIIIESYSTNTSLQDLYKLLEIVMKHFKEAALSVQMACCEVWSKTYNTYASKLSLQQRNLIFFQTLAGIISGGTNRQEQETAVACLQQLYETANQHRDIQFVKDSLKSFVQIFLRSQIEHPSLYFSMEQILQTNKIQEFHNQQMQIVDKCLDTLSNIKCNYRVRVASANVLKRIGIQYQNNNLSIIGGYHEQVIKILDEQTKDRLIAVQNSARVALKEWAKVKINMDACSKQKQQRISNSNDDFDQIVEKQIYNQQQVVVQNQMLDDTINDSLVFSQINNKQYRKKQTGIGGGKVDIAKAYDNRKTENESNKQIKNIIYNNYYSNGALQQLDEDQDLKNKPKDELNVTMDFNELEELEKNQKIQQKQSPINQLKKGFLQQRKPIVKESFLAVEEEEEKQQEPKNVWEQVLQLVKDGNIQEAILILLNEGDDIYLMRLLVMQQDITQFFNSLDQETTQSLVHRFTMVLESDFLNRLCLEFLQDFNDAGVGDMIKEDKFLQFLTYMGSQQDISGKQSQEILLQLKSSS